MGRFFIAKRHIIGIFGIFFLYVLPVQATEYVVTTVADGNTVTDCTDGSSSTLCALREAVMAANDATGVDDSITFSVNGTFAVDSGLVGSGDETFDLDITDTTGILTITGNGTNSTIISRAGTNVFSVNSNAELHLLNLAAVNSSRALYNQGTVQLDGVLIDSNTDTSSGGGIYNDTGASLTVLNSTITNNVVTGSSSRGGGIFNNAGTMRILNTTIAFNAASDRGGGIDDANDTDTTIESSTIVYNDADSDDDSGTDLGGGVSKVNGFSTDLYIKNSIIAHNTENDGALTDKNCAPFQTINSSGYNIDSGTTCAFAQTGDQNTTDPLVDVSGLQDNGGPTETVALQSASPAVDTGSCTRIDTTTLTDDQRGLLRADGLCDVGAYEIDQIDPTITITSNTAGTNSIECNLETFTDPGATVTDNADAVFGELNATPSGEVNEDIVGVYTIDYSATDDAGNVSTQTRTVTVEDTLAPTITVTGSTAITLDRGAAYVDAGATATDSCDTAVTVVPTGTVDTDIPGEYTIIYTAEDDSGNSADQKIRTVTVVDSTPDSGTDNDTDEESNDEESSMVEIKGDDIDNDGDGIVDEVNTIEENGVHPEYGVFDPTDTDVYASTVRSVEGGVNGTIAVTFMDNSVYQYTVFDIETDKKTVAKSFKEKGYVIILHPTAKKLALVNVYTGEVLSTKKLTTEGSKKRAFKIGTIQNKPVVVVTAKKGSTVVLSLVKVQLSQEQFKKKSQQTVKSSVVSVSKTKLQSKKILLRDSNASVVHTYRVNTEMELVQSE